MAFACTLIASFTCEHITKPCLYIINASYDSRNLTHHPHTTTTSVAFVSCHRCGDPACFALGHVIVEPGDINTNRGRGRNENFGNQVQCQYMQRDNPVCIHISCLAGRVTGLNPEDEETLRSFYGCIYNLSSSMDVKMSVREREQEVMTWVRAMAGEPHIDRQQEAPRLWALHMAVAAQRGVHEEPNVAGPQGGVAHQASACLIFFIVPRTPSASLVAHARDTTGGYEQQPRQFRRALAHSHMHIKKKSRLKSRAWLLHCRSLQSGVRSPYGKG